MSTIAFVLVSAAPAALYAAMAGFLMTWRKDPGDEG